MRFKSAFLVFLLLGQLMYAQNNLSSENVNKLALALSAIDLLYVEPIDCGELVNSAISAMTEKLDPHSQYLSAESVKKDREMLTGNFSGIGIQFNIIEDTLYVQQTIVDGPSEKIGILPGDRIVMADTINLTGKDITSEYIQSKLRGPKGTMVRLGVVRRGYNELLWFNVVRDDIPVNSVDAYYMVNKSVGYVSISSFSATTAAELRTVLKEFKSNGMKSLILDLCNNGGGLLAAAVDVASQFLLKNQLVVYTQGRAYRRMNYVCPEDGLFSSGQVVVLINENSASASEIVAGALQDWDRAVIIGRRSFGKGLVQRPVSFYDDSELRLTIAHYYTPSGRSIQKPYGKGIDYKNDLTNRYNNGELESADSIHFADSLKFKTLVKGRTVYGGGGIMPDIFVPIDTTKMSDYYRNLTSKGIILSTVAGFMETNKDDLKNKYANFDKFHKNFNVYKSGLMDCLNRKASEEGVVQNGTLSGKEQEYLEVQLKALTARSLFTINHYYYELNQINSIYNRALIEVGVPKMK